MTSTNIYHIPDIYISQFQPTFVYIKQHVITGLLYFGITTKTGTKFENYHGSGFYWKRHINVYGSGKKNVINLWFCLFTDIHTLVQFTYEFSINNDIVNSPLWANQIIEDGLIASGYANKGSKRSTESCAKMRMAATGRKQSPETVEKRIGHLRGKTRPVEYCERMSIIQKNLNKHLSEETKHLIRIKRASQIISKEQIEKQRESIKHTLLFKNLTKCGFSNIEQASHFFSMYYESSKPYGRWPLLNSKLPIPGKTTSAVSSLYKQLSQLQFRIPVSSH